MHICKYMWACDEWKAQWAICHTKSCALDMWSDPGHSGYTLGGAYRVDFRCCDQAAA